MRPEEIERRFTFHPADTPERGQDHSLVRQQCQALASFLNDWIPEGREKALAVTKLEEVMFWANAAIARRED